MGPIPANTFGSKSATEEGVKRPHSPESSGSEEMTAALKRLKLRGVKRPHSPETSRGEEAATAAEEYRPDCDAAEEYRPDCEAAEEYRPDCEEVEEYVPQPVNRRLPWCHLASECHDPNCQFVAVEDPSGEVDEEDGDAGEYVPQPVPAWRCWVYRQYWPPEDQEEYQPEGTGGGDDEPWGHLASECRNPDCPFIEVALPVHDSDEDAGSEELGERWSRRGWGHLESDCPEGHGTCGCVPVMLPPGCQEAKARARGKGRPRRDGPYQWPGHAFQKKPSTK